jgi:hypothetical protein
MGKITGFLEFERSDRDYEPVEERIKHWREGHQSAARRRTRSAPKKGASCRTTGTCARRGRPSEYAVNLGGHHEVVLVQSLDLRGLQRDRRIALARA